MKVTLAMGLQYEHSPQHPPAGRGDFHAHLKPANDIIDVQAIDVTSGSKIAVPSVTAATSYPYYSPQANLVFMPVIGTRLDIMI